MKARIAVVGGDGIGPEVTAEGVKVLGAVADRFGHEFEFLTAAVGGNAMDDYGTPLPDEAMQTVLSCDAVLLGAVGGPKWDDPAAESRPEDGVLGLRKNLGLFANLRPVKVYPQLIHSSPLRPERLKGVDFVIIRELTGGLYFGKPKKRWNTSRGRRAVDTLKYTEQEIERVARVGFELARTRRNRLHSLDKMNVMQTSRLWREVVTELGDEYPDVELIHMLADNAAMQIVTNPDVFDVIVTENTFGDILSDEAAVIGGSMGMLPSASLTRVPSATPKPRKGAKPDLYEPIHGSAPDITGMGIANPLASILSSAMLLRWSFGLYEEADAVEAAVEGILDEGYRTKSASLTRVPSAKPRPKRGGKPDLYEPIHGSAPDITGMGIANPLASILSSAMLLRWSFGLHAEADAVEAAVEGILDEGYRTREIAMDGDETLNTRQMGDLIASRIN